MGNRSRGSFRCRRGLPPRDPDLVDLGGSAFPSGGRPADERTRYPKEWLGLTYPDSKHQGERVGLEAADRHGVEVVVVNPGYVLGVPLDRESPREIRRARSAITSVAASRPCSTRR